MSTQMTYREYLRLDELLTLQRRHSQPPSRHELLFIIQHQVAELWMKAIIDELHHGIGQLRDDDLRGSLATMARVRRIQQHLADQWSVLETLTVDDFAQFRELLRPASGGESDQYHKMEALLGSPDEPTGSNIFIEYVRMLHRRGHPVAPCCLVPARQHRPCPLLLDVLREVHARRAEFVDEYLMGEALLDLEENLQLWRFRHLSTVRRIIGDASGTGGSTGAAFLESRLRLRAFPELYAVRSVIAGEWPSSPTGGCPMA